MIFALDQKSKVSPRDFNYYRIIWENKLFEKLLFLWQIGEELTEAQQIGEETPVLMILPIRDTLTSLLYIATTYFTSCLLLSGLTSNKVDL